MTALMDRFWSKVNKTETCWLWTANVDRDGYGQFYFEGRSRPAHIAAYRMFVGPIPAGMEIDHVAARGCAHRHCVNPAHLEAVPHAENIRRGAWSSRGTAASVSARRARTECKNGHEYTDLNTYWYSGRRHCRRCRADAAARSRRARRTAA